MYQTHKHRKFLGKVINIILIFFITVILAEIGLRLYNEISPLFIFYDNSYNRFRGEPLSYDYDFRLNSRGFKDLEFTKAKGRDYRILGIGDSFAFGVVPYEYNYLTILENDLNAGHGSIELINMGIPSTGPKDYVSILIDEGVELNPDLVLVSFFVGNDFAESRETKRKIYSYSYVATLIKYVFQIRPTYKGRIIHGRAVYQDEEETFSYDKFLAIEKNRINIYKKGNDQVLEMLENAVDWIRQIKDICETKGIDIMVIIIPDEVQINQTLQSEVIEAMKARPKDFNFSLPNNMLSSKLEDLDISHIDLYNYFLRSSKSKRLYKPNDTHWNIAGNKLAAETIKNYIIEKFGSDFENKS